MSAKSVILSAQKFIEDQRFSSTALSDIKPALNLANAPILQLVYEIALDAGFSHEQACQRTIPVLLQNCAIHLADDIADGDCDYLPLSQAATALYTLQQLVALSISCSDIASPSTFFQLLAQVGNAQHEEIATQQWTLEQSKNAAEGLNGQQFKAYFYIASASSPIQAEMEALGYSFGIVNHLANDIMSRDPRIMSLSSEDQVQLRLWGLEHAQSIIDAELPTLSSRLPPLLRYLR